jgi:uncharacterized protein
VTARTQDAWQVDVRHLLASPGEARRVEIDRPIEGLSSELAQVSGPVRMEALLESVVEGILVSGPVSGRMQLRCARCLRPFEEDLRLEVEELFAPDASEDDDDRYPLHDDTADLAPMVRDAVVLALPFSPLCRADCLGLCERCGGDRNLGECTCAEPVDPRWAQLQDIEFD